MRVLGFGGGLGVLGRLRLGSRLLGVLRLRGGLRLLRLG
jgi:hypothetical protein